MQASVYINTVKCWHSKGGIFW